MISFLVLVQNRSHDSTTFASSSHAHAADAPAHQKLCTSCAKAKAIADFSGKQLTCESQLIQPSRLRSTDVQCVPRRQTSEARNCATKLTVDGENLKSLQREVYNYNLKYKIAESERRLTNSNQEAAQLFNLLQTFTDGLTTIIVAYIRSFPGE